MEWNKKNLLLWGSVVGIAVLLYLILKKKKTTPATTTNTAGTAPTIASTATTTIPTSNGTAILDFQKILKKGVTGNEVKALQKILNLVYDANLIEDGVFGSKTETALVQASAGEFNQITLNIVLALLAQAKTDQTITLQQYNQSLQILGK